MKRIITGIIRVLVRNIWGAVYVLWLYVRKWIWGTSAFEHAVFHAPPWLALRILSAFGVSIGHGIDFHGRLNLHGTYDMKNKLKIGEWCHIGPMVTLDLTARITIEDKATISLNAQILTHMDVGYSPLRETAFPTESAPVVVESGAYVGAGAIILMGVRIGRESIVAAGAVVTQDVPANTIVAGVPAKVVRKLV